MRSAKVQTFRSAVVLVALLITGCRPRIVEGVVVERLPRTWAEWHYDAQGNLVMDKEAEFKMIIESNGRQKTYFLDPESWCNAWEDDVIHMECHGDQCSGLVVTRHFWEK